jgi:hypothetical protein
MPVGVMVVIEGTYRRIHGILRIPHKCESSLNLCCVEIVIRNACQQ